MLIMEYIYKFYTALHTKNIKCTFCWDKRVNTHSVSTIACNAIPSASIKTSQRISFRWHGYMIHRHATINQTKVVSSNYTPVYFFFSVSANSSCDLNI